MRKFTRLLMVLIILVIAFLFYQGIFYPVRIKEQAVGDYWLVYRENIGSYNKVGKIIKEISRDLKSEGIETKMTFGLYYDDPKKVEKTKLRSEVGAIFEGDYSKIRDLRSDCKIRQLIGRNSLVTEFPLRNNLSYMIGAIKVYPAMEKYCKKKNIDIDKIENGYSLEIYNMEKRKITYILPID